MDNPLKVYELLAVAYIRVVSRSPKHITPQFAVLRLRTIKDNCIDGHVPITVYRHHSRHGNDASERTIVMRQV